MSDDPVLAALSRLEAGQAGVAATVTALRVDLMARMDRLENSLTDIRNDIGVNFGASDAVKQANDNTRAELRALGEIVSGLVRKVRTLETRLRDVTGDP